MPEHARKRPRRHLIPGPVPLDDHRRIGDDALKMTRWFVKSKYHLMGGFLAELTDEPRDPELVQERFCRALHHGHRVYQVRGVVTFLLALGIIATATSAIANVLDVEAPTGILERAAALTGSASVLLVALRLALDRYLERCDVAATFLAIQLGAGSRP